MRGGLVTVVDNAMRWRQSIVQGNRLSVSLKEISLDNKEEIKESKKNMSLVDLPYDVLLDIVVYLELRDVLVVAQVSRIFHEVTRAGAVWQKISNDLMCRGRRLYLLDHLFPSDLNAPHLQSAVLKTCIAESNWSRAYPRRVVPARMVKLHRDIVLDQLSYVMKYVSSRHVVLPTADGDLVGWDVLNGNEAGRYKMGRQSVLINVQGHYSERSLYWITGRYIGLENDHMTLKLVILRVVFPSAGSNERFEFQELQQMHMPCSFAVELHFLSVERRMFCSVFAQNGTTGLIVFLDWGIRLCAIVDLGLIYEYGKTIIGVQLSSDGDTIVLHSNDAGEEICRFYSLAEISQYAAPWDPTDLPSRSFPLVHPMHEHHSSWTFEPPALTYGDLSPHTVWVLPQWWPTGPNVPKRTSTIILYISYDGTTTPSRRCWRALQHYSTDGSTPCINVRSVVEIEDPVLIPLGEHGVPILAHGFNHLGWVEETNVRVDLDDSSETEDFLQEQRSSKKMSRLRRSSMNLLPFTRRSRKEESGSTGCRWRRRRALKLVTFPDPGVSPLHRREDGTISTVLRPVTLDVPECVLNDAYHIYLDAAAGTITVATVDNTLHVFSYS